MRGVAEMRGQRRTGADGVADLLFARGRVADTDGYALARQALNVSGRLRPFGSQRDQADQASRRILPA